MNYTEQRGPLIISSEYLTLRTKFREGDRSQNAALTLCRLHGRHYAEMSIIRNMSMYRILYGDSHENSI